MLVSCRAKGIWNDEAIALLGHRATLLPSTFDAPAVRNKHLGWSAVGNDASSTSVEYRELENQLANIQMSFLCNSWKVTAARVDHIFVGVKNCNSMSILRL